MANEDEGGEIAGPLLRVGMKRELAMLMKAQTECGINDINVSQGRVTRSKVGGLSTNSSSSPPKISGSGAKSFSSEGLSVKKRKGLENGVLEKVKMEGLSDMGSLGANVGEREVLISEKDEVLKRGVVGGVCDEQKKGDISGEALVEGEGNVGMGLEKVGSDVVQNVLEMGSDERAVGDNVGSSGSDSIGENVRGEVAKDNGNSATPSRRFTRSVLKSSVENSSLSGKDGGKDIIGNENSAKPLRRFTRSVLNKKSEIEDEKCEALESDSNNPVSSSQKLEMKMSKKVELKNTPTTLKDLLETGLLEGLHVRYAQSAEARFSREEGLHGEIHGPGILCFCDECKGTQVVTPNQFELHAGSENKSPSESIYLENGKTLHDVLTICKDAPSDSLGLVIQISVGRANTNEPMLCLRCKGTLPKPSMCGRMLCDSCMASTQVCPPGLNDGSAQFSSPSLPSFSPEQSFVKVPPSSHSRSKGEGKVTRKDLRLHKLVFESDLLPDGTQLTYYAHGKKMREGYKSGHGIYCNCCQQVVSASTFEAHAGFPARRKPYNYIYTSNGVSLHELSIEIKKTLMVSTDENDDVCSICEGMGELLCCDNCPRSFHKECVNLPSIPQDRWYCPYCESMFQREKFVSSNINAVAAGRVAGVDPFEEIKKRCIRIVETVATEDGGCVLCRGRDFSKLGFGTRTVILCDQCEREYHIGCLKEHVMGDLQDLPDEWFCCTECSTVHSALQELVNGGEKMLPDSMLSIIHKKYDSTVSEGDCDFNLTWRLLRGKMASEDDRKWLSGAVSVFHDRFDPIGHSNARRNDLIPFMIYGRSNKEHDFGGMYCAILVLNSTVVSAGIVRIFGREVAEIPLVATSSDFQGKGYFQSLFGLIENLLQSLDVKTLVLPAASEAEAIWMNRFGFEKISDEKLNEYRKDYPMMIFQGTSVLHKLVPRPESSTGAKDT